MPSFELKIGTVSWIDADVSPIWFSGKAKMLEPEWLPKTYMGLTATSNPDPRKSIDDFKYFQDRRNFRACTYCHIGVGIDENNRIGEFKVLDAFHDPGWTPPFSLSEYPLAGLKVWDDDIWSFEWHKGEASPISIVYTRKRHPNSVIPTPAGETVLINALIKFRAGKHTDDVGIDSVGAPFHVPWVWHETLVTYKDHKIKLYGRGSVFPSHAWYVDGQRVARKKEVSDKSFPMKTKITRCFSNKGYPLPRCETEETDQINYRHLNLYKVLSVGASANGPQTAASDDDGRAGRVDRHPNTVGGGKMVTHMQSY
jgi:hypothetical protein